jgi:glycerophosphoryl diester phosphodiesterase
MVFAMAKNPVTHPLGSAHMSPIMYPLPMVIGHRGAKDIAPENTIAAMRAAKAVGTTCVEVDVMLTKDGVPVIHHDNTVDSSQTLSSPTPRLFANGRACVREAWH